MPLATVYTRAQHGLEAPQVSAEVQLSGGLPGLVIVGLVETAVRESRERVRAAIRQAGFAVPQRKITVNLAPADLPKAGSRFDLAIAVGILAASGQIPSSRLEQHEFFGELAFSGALRPVSALLPALVRARASDRRCVVPVGCEAEASLVPDGGSLMADHLLSVVRYLKNDGELAEIADAAGRQVGDVPAEDLADVRGQYQARRALEIAAAGGHNLLMIGPPGTGKSMLARRLPGILPPLKAGEALEVATIHSLRGDVDDDRTLTRPFRAPHHTASAVAMVGGGRPPRPGEISLAHRGVLFLDELPEYPRNVLEALREPLEMGRVNIARAERSVEFPARFQLVAAMNPCPCGFHGDPKQECRCSPDQVRRYRNRVSGPFLDRIDLTLTLNREQLVLSEWSQATAEDSATVRQRVQAANRLQRRGCGVINSQLDDQAVRRWCWPDSEGRRLLEKAAARFALSRRACHRSLRVARTIGDLAGSEMVTAQHVSEALMFQSL